MQPSENNKVLYLAGNADAKLWLFGLDPLAASKSLLHYLIGRTCFTTTCIGGIA